MYLRRSQSLLKESNAGEDAFDVCSSTELCADRFSSCFLLSLERLDRLIGQRLYARHQWLSPFGDECAGAVYAY